MSVDIGKRLKHARESKGISLEELEARTRIHRKYLMALENGQFELLPSPVYVRSYLRSYANAVGENPQNILKYYRPPARPSSSLEQTSSFRSVDRGGRRELSLPSPTERMSPGPDDSYGQHTETHRGWSRTRYRSAQGREEADLHQPQVDSGAYSTSLTKRSIRTSRDQAGYPEGSLPESRRVSYRSANVQGEETFRKPIMPPDVPDPEELGIGFDAGELSGKEGRYSSLPSRRHLTRSGPHQSESTEENDQKKSGFTFGRLYTWMLVAGAVLLIIATGYFMYYRMTTASGQPGQNPSVAQQETKEGTSKPAGKPILTMLFSSQKDADRYELYNAEKLELKIVSRNGGSSGFEIRDQEVADPLVKDEVTPSKEFTKSFTTGIWLTLSQPNQVEVTVNGKPIVTDIYTNEKVINISFVR
ncbi:helix-turn-helix domain-containing protein [Lihuaxuella thermophila]|uniref:Helix-turn-helix domain-containing protein n=1 Tax=Lihuaxuella thermophila TaxID=1173111 RepID=A0A1H8GJG9_9BACL|nr:helix-turn-helix domain-containing protein [Lihuaxuella thermophila]SEN43949.1 Helix-turn-helix domain-containing protein [Lihuaxuella thermophila]